MPAPSSSHHLVDPELLPILDVYQPMQLDPAALPEVRKQRAAMAQAILRDLPPDDIERSEHVIPGADGAPATRVLVYRPRSAQGTLGVYINIHGGGLVGGLPEQGEPTNRQLAADLGCVVVAPAYRLAPEHPYPAALDDCHAAFAWVVRNAAELRIDPARIVLGGASAGGGLAAALALQLRDRKLTQPALLLLVFPMLDDRTGSTRQASPFAGEYIWTAPMNHFGWSCYLGHEPGGPEVSEYAAPARAATLAGLPPTWIGCGALDLFLDENLEFTRRLAADGVPAELHVYPGAFHAFQWIPTAQVTQAFNRDCLSALARAFNRRDAAAKVL